MGTRLQGHAPYRKEDLWADDLANAERRWAPVRRLPNDLESGGARLTMCWHNKRDINNWTVQPGRVRLEGWCVAQREPRSDDGEEFTQSRAGGSAFTLC